MVAVLINQHTLIHTQRCTTHRSNRAIQEKYISTWCERWLKAINKQKAPKPIRPVIFHRKNAHKRIKQLKPSSTNSPNWNWNLCCCKSTQSKNENNNTQNQHVKKCKENVYFIVIWNWEWWCGAGCRPAGDKRACVRRGEDKTILYVYEL